MPPQNIIKGGKKLPPLKNQKRGKFYTLFLKINDFLKRKV